MMNKKNVLLGLALGAVVLFSCNRQGEKSEVGQPKLSGKEKIEEWILKNDHPHTEEEGKKLAEEFLAWDIETYQEYIRLRFKDARSVPTLSLEELKQNKEEVDFMLSFAFKLLGKYPSNFTPEEWNAFDKEYNKKKDCSKLNCPTKSFPYTMWAGTGFNTISAYVSNVNAQGQNDCDYEFEVSTGGKSIVHMEGHGPMKKVISSNSNWLNYRDGGSYSYFLVGKNRVIMAYLGNIVPPTLDFRVQVRN